MIVARARERIRTRRGTGEFMNRAKDTLLRRVFASALAWCHQGGGDTPVARQEVGAGSVRIDRVGQECPTSLGPPQGGATLLSPGKPGALDWWATNEWDRSVPPPCGMIELRVEKVNAIWSATLQKAINLLDSNL